MSSDNKLPWILAGYDLFANHGPDGLKVEVIARRVNKSKSSFYHYFADLEIFTDVLLTYHLERAGSIAQQEKQCQQVDPDLLNLLISVKQDLLFNRQLRVHRNNAAFKKCLGKTTRLVSEAIIGIWAAELGLANNSSLAQLVLNMSIENFYLQLTTETLTYPWLAQYIQGLKIMVSALQKPI